MTPAPTKILFRRGENRLELQWPDTRVSRFSIWRIRCECPCAGCVDENTGLRTLNPADVPENVTIVHMQPVGGYALKISFSDGHDTGLYTWRHLASLPAEPST